MSHRAVFAGAFSWILLGAVATIGQDTATLRGTVIEDHSDVPVAGAVLRLPLGTAGTAEIETDSRGAFATPALPAGDTFDFQVIKAGYIPVSIRLDARSLHAAKSLTRPLTIRLVRKGAISGRVPWARDGTVLALEVVPEGRRPRLFRARVTDRGEFRIFDLPLGRYTIGVLGGSTTAGVFKRGLVSYPPDGTPAEFTITGGDDVQDVSIGLPQFDSFTVGGRVTFPDPATRLRMSLTMVAARHPSGAVYATQLGEGNTFRITGLVPGSYDLLVRANPVEAGSTLLFGRLHVDLGPQDVDHLEISLQPAIAQAFTMANDPDRSSNGCGVSGMVTLTPLQDWIANLEMSLPLSSSTGTTFMLPPGRYEVAGRDDAQRCFSKTPLDLIEARPDRLNPAMPTALLLQPTATIHGHASASGIVGLLDMTPGREPEFRVAISAANSEFHFDSVAPGQYYVAALSATGIAERWVPVDAHSRSITIRPGEAKEVDLR